VTRQTWRRGGLVIIADSREPPGLIMRLREVVPVEVTALHTGDFLIVDRDGCTIGIERKELNDFLNAFALGRLQKQLTRLRRAYKPILLLEGPYGMDDDGRLTRRGRSTGWWYLSIQMALLAIQNTGIRVIQTTNYETTVAVLRGLHQRAGEQCLAGLDDWGMGDDDGGGPEGGPGDARLDSITSLVGGGLQRGGDPTVGVARKPRAAAQRKPVGSEPPTLTISRAALPRDGGRAS